MEVFVRFQAASTAIEHQCPAIAKPFMRRMPSAVHVGDRLGLLSGETYRVVSAYWVLSDEPQDSDFNTTPTAPVGQVVELAP